MFLSRKQDIFYNSGYVDYYVNIIKLFLIEWQGYICSSKQFFRHYATQQLELVMIFQFKGSIILAMYTALKQEISSYSL